MCMSSPVEAPHALSTVLKCVQRIVCVHVCDPRPQPLDDCSANAGIDICLATQASAFNKLCRIYAPRFRQVRPALSSCSQRKSLLQQPRLNFYPYHTRSTSTQPFCQFNNCHASSWLQHTHPPPTPIAQCPAHQHTQVALGIWGPEREQASNLAYSDVKAAFVHFIDSLNGNRPFIIASHSQGTRLALRLLADCVEGTPLADRFIAGACLCVCCGM